MVEEMREAVIGDRRYTRVETCGLAGVPLDRATALWRAMGFAELPDDAVFFTDRDVEALRTIETLRGHGVVDDDGLLALTRTMAQALSRLAVSHARIAASFIAADLSDEATHRAGEELLPAVASLLEYVWRRHLAVAAEDVLASLDAPSAAPVAVGFVDLVGYTELSRSSTPSEIEALVERFEHAVATLVADAGGRVVKTLGDEVMFAVDAVDRAASLALSLAEADLGREVRVGLAYGPVVVRMGDVFGPTVNIASRLTGLAYPGTVLVDREAAAALRDRYDLSPLRRHAVRGYAHLAPFRLRRADATP